MHGKDLFQRNEQGKAGEFVTNDLDQIAKVLLHDGAKVAADLGSLESILRSLPKDQADALMAELEQDQKLRPKTESVITLADANHNRIVELINRLADSR